jgi:hypothetical protein
MQKMLAARRKGLARATEIFSLEALFHSARNPLEKVYSESAILQRRKHILH